MRVTYPILKVLHVFGDGAGPLCGADITREVAVTPGTLYPLLARLEKAGLLKSSWEKVDPSEVGRPRRRFYKITRAGMQWARKAKELRG